MNARQSGYRGKKDLFDQYLKAGKEIAQIEKELYERHTVTDSVKGSMTESPYIERIVQIKGVDVTVKLDVQKMLAKRRRDLERMRLDMEICLSTIDDCLLAAILRARYVEGMSWQAVAWRIGGQNSAAGVKMKALRYFRSQK